MVTLPGALSEGDSPFGEGAVALVTGATSGIGLDIARQLVERGLPVWVGARNLAKGRAVARDLGHGARAVQLDVTDRESIAQAAHELSTLDVLVNNAGINPGNENITQATLEQLRATYETNVFR